jgi:hypothetical protein
MAPAIMMTTVSTFRNPAASTRLASTKNVVHLGPQHGWPTNQGRAGVRSGPRAYLLGEIECLRTTRIDGEGRDHSKSTAGRMLDKDRRGKLRASGNSVDKAIDVGIGGLACRSLHHELDRAFGYALDFDSNLGAHRWGERIGGHRDDRMG